MKRLIPAVVALLGLPAPALAQRAAPPEIRSNGDIWLGNASKLGTRRPNSKIDIVDTMSAAGMPFSDIVASIAYMPPPSGNADTDAANFAATQGKGARVVLLQSGEYFYGPNGWPALTSGQEIVGQGSLKTKLTATAVAAPDAEGVLRGFEVSDVVVRGLTVDYKGLREPRLAWAPVAFRNIANLRVSDVQITGYPRFGFTINGGSDFRVENVSIIRSTTPLDANGAVIPKGVQNQCVIVSEGVNPVNRGVFSDVYCNGSAFNTSGADIDYIRTEVDRFDFGNAYVTEQGANSLRHRFYNVKARSGRSNPDTGLDMNNTSAGCFEIWSPGSIVEGSECDNVGGGGLALGGKNSRVTNNRFTRLGMQVGSEGIGARYELGGQFSADGSLIANNVIVNTNGSGDGSNLVHAYQEQSLTEAMTVRLVGNDFGPAPFTRKGLGAKWAAPGMLLKASSGAYTHSPGSILAPIDIAVVGARRKGDVIASVSFQASDGSALPTGVRAFAEVNADNNVKFYTQDISGGSSNIPVPAGTFTARLISVD